MRGIDLIHIAQEWNCVIQFALVPPTKGTKHREKVSLYQGSRHIMDFAVCDGQMPWQGYELAKTLQERCRETTP